MLNTPWGDAGTLREKQLRPGGGIPAEEVARNQRERLFAAMVAIVDQKGFEATTVADLLELSGISRTTFYEHFDDKRDCFVAAVEAIVETTATLAERRVAEISDGEAKARTLLDAFVKSILAQPAASRMCFVEASAAGRGALIATNRAVSRFEDMLREAGEQTPGREGMPDEMRSAIIGAIYLIVHARLYRREEAELEALAPELWEWAFSHRPPPRPLGSVPIRRPTSVPEDLARAPGARPPTSAADPAERIIRGFAAVVAEKGYPATTIAEIADRASVSQSTFYSHFKGRKAVLLSALDTAGARMMAAILPAARRGETWPQSMRLALRALGAFGVDEPDLASLLAVGSYAAGPLALVRRDEVTAGLQGMFTPGYELSPDTTPPIAAEASVRAIYSLMYNKIAVSGAQSLPAMVPMATYIALGPYIGAEQACEVVTGD